MLTIELTGELNAYSIDRYLPLQGKRGELDLRLDLRGVTAVKAGGLCMLTCLIACLARNEERDLRLELYPPQGAAADSFFNFGFVPVIRRWTTLTNYRRDWEELRAKTSKLQRFEKRLALEIIAESDALNLRSKFESDCQRFINRAASVFEKALIKQLPQVSIREFWRSNTELFKNVYDHSDSWGVVSIDATDPSGSVFCFHDVGKGICNTVRSALNSDKISDRDAIDWALREGNSSRSGNSGLGLAILASFVAQHGGIAHIRSGNAIVISHGDRRRFRDAPYFPGTHVDCFIPTQKGSSDGADS